MQSPSSIIKVEPKIKNLKIKLIRISFTQIKHYITFNFANILEFFLNYKKNDNN